ncbi:glucosyltransferase domain-containing protein [Enterococcus sp. LJL90]
MPTTSKESTSIFAFLKQQLGLTIFCLVAVALVYAPKIFNYSFSIDTERMMADPEGTLSWWLALNRYGLVFLKRVLPWGTSIYPVFINVMTYFLLTVTVLLLCYMFWRSSKKISTPILFAASLVAITAPSTIEQTNFILQSIEVQLAVIFQLIAILMIQMAFEKKTKTVSAVLLIAALFLSTFSFAIYQSLQVSFVVLAILSVYLKTNEETTIVDYLKQAIPYIAVLVLSFIGYLLINKLVYQMFNIAANGYISFDFYFLQIPFKNYIVETAWLLIRNLFSIHRPFFLGFFSVFGVLFLLAVLFNRKNTLQRKISLTITVGVLFLCVSFLILTLGWVGPIRSYYPTIYFVLFFLTAAIATELDSLKIKRGLLLFSLVISLFQGFSTFRLGQTTNMIFQQEQTIAESIQTEIANLGITDPENYQLVAYGEIDFSGLQILKGEIIGASFFEFDTDAPTGNTRRIADFLFAEGFPIGYSEDSAKYQELAAVAQSMPSYPEDGYLQVIDHYVVVNLGEQ